MRRIETGGRIGTALVAAALVAGALGVTKAERADAIQPASDCDTIVFHGIESIESRHLFLRTDGSDEVTKISQFVNDPDHSHNHDYPNISSAGRISWKSDDGLKSADLDGLGRRNISRNDGQSPTVTNETVSLHSPDGTKIAWLSRVDGGTTTHLVVADADGTNRVVVSTTADGGSTFSPAWSPDSTKLAWTQRDTTTNQLMIANADGTGLYDHTALTGVGGTTTGQAAWSPDGTKLAFVAKPGSRNEVFVADAADGGNLISVSTADISIPQHSSANGPQWSPDGTKITYSASTTLDPADWVTNIGWHGYIWIIDADGQNRHPISHVDSPPYDYASSPRWSPAGTRILWMADFDVWTADVDGTNLLNVSAADTDPDPTSNRNGVWSADGSKIAWRGEPASGGDVIFLADADGTNRFSVSDVEQGFDPALPWYPAWSPDGTQIVYSAQDESDETQIYVIDAAGTTRTRISDVGGGDDPTDNIVPEWSPDGSKILWQGDCPGDYQNPHIANTNGSGRIFFPDPPNNGSTTPAWNQAPTFSPDGSRVAFTGYTVPLRRQIWVADDDGNNLHPISDAGGTILFDTAGAPDWGPHDKIVFAGRRLGGTRSIWVAESDGSAVTDLWADLPGTLPDPRNPRWSPDGSKIAFDGFTDVDGRQVYVMNGDGSGLTQISLVHDAAPLNNASDVRWSPGGERVSWLASDDDISANFVYIANADGSERERVTDPDDSLTETSFARWQPRHSSLDVQTSMSPLVLGEQGSLEITVSAPCAALAVELSGMVPDCLAGPTIEVSSGAATDGTWTFPALDAGGTHTATVTGTVIDDGECGTTLNLDAVTPAQEGGLAQVAAADVINCASPESPFTDVDGSSFAFDDVACLFNLEITNGVGPGLYGPADLVTRQQMAAFIERLITSLDGDCDLTATPFTDIAELTYGQDSIACIYNLGITKGTSGTTYSPGWTVSRLQMAAFLGRLWEALGGECDDALPPFTDTLELSYGQDEIACIYNLGITTGTSATTYSPWNDVTREQMAAFLGRLWRKAKALGLG